MSETYLLHKVNFDRTFQDFIDDYCQILDNLKHVETDYGGILKGLREKTEKFRGQVPEKFQSMQENLEYVLKHINIVFHPSTIMRIENREKTQSETTNLRGPLLSQFVGYFMNTLIGSYIREKPEGLSAIRQNLYNIGNQPIFCLLTRTMCFQFCTRR